MTDYTELAQLMRQIIREEVPPMVRQIVQEETADLRAAIVALGGRMVSLETRMGSLEGRMDSLETDMGQVKTTLVAMQNHLGQIDQQIDSINGNITRVDQELHNINTNLTKIDDELRDINQNVRFVVISSGTEFNLLKSRLDKIEEQLNRLEQSNLLQVEQIRTMNDDVLTARSQWKLQQIYPVAERDFHLLKSKVEELETRLMKLELVR